MNLLRERYVWFNKPWLWWKAERADGFLGYLPFLLLPPHLHYKSLRACWESKHMSSEQPQECTKKGMQTLEQEETFNTGFQSKTEPTSRIWHPLTILIKPIENSPWSSQLSVEINKKVNARVMVGQLWFFRDLPSFRLKAFINSTQRRRKKQKTK